VSHLRPLGELAPLGQALRLLGFIQLSRGEFAAAREHIEEWVAIARRLNRPLAAAWGMHGRAWVDLRAGDLDQAAATLSEVSLLAQALGARTLGTATTITTSGIALARDDHETAQLLFVELLRSKPDDAWARTYALEGLVLTAAARGQHECVLLLAGAAQAILGSTRVATEPEWSDQVGRAVAAARTEAGPRAGGLLAEGARLTLDEAIDCAVHGWTHPPSAGRLGKRELQVARLVAKGLTNDQIAGELHISRRTVATHLEHVREKLGLRSRIDIAIWSTENDRDLP
jgi:DNA-binding NarL/FixJ family response regulator